MLKIIGFEIFKELKFPMCLNPKNIKILGYASYMIKKKVIATH